MAARLRGADGEIPPFLVHVSNAAPEAGSRTLPGGKFDWGGRLLRVTEAREGHLRAVGNRPASVKAQGGLTARHTSRAGTKV